MPGEVIREHFLVSPRMVLQHPTQRRPELRVAQDGAECAVEDLPSGGCEATTGWNVLPALEVNASQRMVVRNRLGRRQIGDARGDVVRRAVGVVALAREGDDLPEEARMV